MPNPPHLFEEPSYINSIPHLPTVELCILHTAYGFTALGRIDAARDFAELYYSRPALKNKESAWHALVPYWRKTRFPAGIPDRIKTDEFFDEYMSLRQQRGLQWPYYTPLDQRTEDEAGLTAILSPAPDHNGRCIKTAPILALDLGIKLAEKQAVEPSRDAKVLEVLACIAQDYENYREHASLIYHATNTSLLMSGALAKIWGLSDQELDSRAAELLEAARQRYWHGPSSASPKTISVLLQSCNHDTVTAPMLDDVQETPTSLYKPPATEQEVLDLEQRLGIILPDDFKAFLRISNGFGEIWNGFHHERPLLSIAEIDWLEYREHELLADQLNLTGLEDHRTTVEELPKPPIINNVICIASERIDHVWLISPQMVHQMREHLKKVYDLVNEQGKRLIERAVDDFAGSWREWEALEWNCCSLLLYGEHTSCENFKDFTAWLESSTLEAKYHKYDGTEQDECYCPECDSDSESVSE